MEKTGTDVNVLQDLLVPTAESVSYLNTFKV